MLACVGEGLGQGLWLQRWGDPPAELATERFAESLRALPLATQVALDEVQHALAEGPLPAPLQQLAFQAIARLAYRARADVDTASPLLARQQLEALAAFAEADGRTELGAQALLHQLARLADQIEA